MSFVGRLHRDVNRARILTLDIETKPGMSRHFGMFNQNIGLAQVVEPVTLLSFAAKWRRTRQLLARYRLRGLSPERPAMLPERQ